MPVETARPTFTHAYCSKDARAQREWLTQYLMSRMSGVERKNHETFARPSAIPCGGQLTYIERDIANEPREGSNHAYFRDRRDRLHRFGGRSRAYQRRAS